jgi:drug/metabolite transporter (DMT)-like permease
MPKVRELVASRGRIIASLLGGLAVVFVFLGVMLLTTWEVNLFRATIQDTDFTGLECGTPLNNPGWQRNEPCDGAVSRQLAGAVMLLVVGAALAVAVILGRRDRRRPGRRPQTFSEAGLAYVRDRFKMGDSPRGRDGP